MECRLDSDCLTACVSGVCGSRCGDGVLQGDEACDDGNTRALDGCGATCTRELSEREPNDDGTPHAESEGIAGNDFDAQGIAVANAEVQGVIDVALGDTARVGALQVRGDEDVFAFVNGSDVSRSVRVDVWNGETGPGSPCGADTDLGLNLRTRAGVLMADNDDRNGVGDRCPGLTFAVAPFETVYLHLVANGDARLVPAWGFTVVVSPVGCGDGVVTPGVEECDAPMPTLQCDTQCRVPAIDEVEANDTLAQASDSPVQLVGNARVRGVLSTHDVDLYRLTVGAPALMRFETFVGTSGDCDATALELRVLDAAGTVLVEDLVSAGAGGCALLLLPVEAGTYFVQVEERGRDAPVTRYFLEVSTGHPMGGEAEAPGSSGGNDSPATASRNLGTVLDGWVHGDHMLSSDVDVYAILVPPRMGVRAELVEGDRATETCESHEIDSVVALLNADGVMLAGNDDSGRGYCSRIDGLGALSSQARFSLARNPTAIPQVMYLRVTRSPSGLATPSQFSYRLQVNIR